MWINNKILMYVAVLSAFCLNGEAFVSPSQKQLELTPFAVLDKALQLRKTSIPDREALLSLTEQEEEGFLGYHGDSLDFLIYQDIIRLVIELLVEIPIRQDFHFLAPPLDPVLKIQTKAKLAEVLTDHENPALVLYDATFPLNFTLWDNANRLGLNSIEQFTKNESVKPLGYKKRLSWFFKNLGISQNQIDQLYDVAYKSLKTNRGIILQIFDSSAESYSFSKKIAYPAYPNGYLSENRTVDEYYEDEQFVPPYPHEVRLLLTNKETLNPTNGLKIVRFVDDISSQDLKNYEKALKSKIQKLAYDKKAKNSYQSKLKKAWGLK